MNYHEFPLCHGKTGGLNFLFLNAKAIVKISFSSEQLFKRNKGSWSSG